MIGFWIFMLITDLLIPCAMIGFGKLFLNKTPQNINYTFGYRTTMSMNRKPEICQEGIFISPPEISNKLLLPFVLLKAHF